MTASAVSDSHLAQLYLVQDLGFTPDDARQALLLDHQLTASLKDKIALKRRQIEAEAAVAVQAEYERSPEGRKEAALQAAKAARERAELAEGARAMLGEDAEGLSESELLDAAGIEEGPITKARLAREEDERLANDVQANWRAANADLIEENSQ
jgi:hypothetical protein